jgi:hypothetical protein
VSRGRCLRSLRPLERRWIGVHLGWGFGIGWLVGVEEWADDLGIDLIGVACGRGPDESARVGLDEPPAVVGLVDVVCSVQRAEITVGGRATFVGWSGVVGVAAVGGPGARREPAGPVAGDDVVGEVCGRAVAGGAVVEQPPLAGSVSSRRQVPLAASWRATSGVIGP